MWLLLEKKYYIPLLFHNDRSHRRNIRTLTS